MKSSLYFSIAGLMYLILAVFPALHAQTSPPGFTHQAFTTESGLPTNLLTGLVQTIDGYLWIGTQDGLVRFDGARFTVFNSANTEAFTNNRIGSLWTSPPGDLWVQTADASLLHHRGGRFTRLDFGGESASSIWTDMSGIWIATQTRLFHYTGGRLDTVVAGLWDARVVSLMRTRDGAFWLVGQDSSVFRVVDGKAHRLLSPRPPPAGATRPLRPRLLHEAVDGAIWIRAAGELWLHRDGRFSPVPLRREIPLNEVLALATDAEGQFLLELRGGKTLLVATDGTYRELPPTDPRFQAHSTQFPDALKCQHGPAGSCFVEGRPVARISFAQAAIQDHEGGFWVASDMAGLHYFRPALMTAHGQGEGLSDPVVYALAEDAGGAVWTVGAKDLYRFEGGEFRVAFPFEEGLISDLYTDRAGSTWFIRGGRVYRIDAGKLHPFAEHTLPPTTALYQDEAGRYWFATRDGLYAYLDGHWTTHPEVNRGIVGPYQITGTRDGAIWILTDHGGLRRFHQDRLHCLTTEHGLSFSDVRHLYEDEDGFLWVATGGRGLNRIDRSAVGDWDDGALSRLQITSYHLRDGLFDEVIHRIVEDDQGRLWMSTNRGIFWVRRADLNAFAEGRLNRVHSVAYDTRHGMRDSEANRLGGLKGRHGKLWFSTMGGVVRIDPNAVKRTASAPVVVEQLRAGGEAITAEAGTLRLVPEMRTFEIDFTAPAFFNPDSVEFRYRLEGYEDDWVVTDRRTAFYTKVSPGQYRFRVTTLGEEETADEATLTVIVEPHWYETRWFFLLSFLLGVSLVTGLVWTRVQALRASERRLEALVQERTAQLTILNKAKSQFFANISHEFRTPLTLQIGPLKDLQDGRHGPLSPDAKDLLAGVIRSSQRLLRLVNELLDLAQLEVGSLKLEARPGNLTALVQETVHAFLPLAEHIGVALRCQTMPLPAMAFDADKLEKVLVNLLSNAFKFTPAGGQVTVTTQMRKGHVEIAVADTGRGIPEDAVAQIFERFYHGGEGNGLQASTGLGLGLAKELVLLHGGRIEARSRLEMGSTFTVFLPAGTPPLAEAIEASAEADAGLRAASAGGPLPLLPTATDPTTRVPLKSAEQDEEQLTIDRTTVLIVEDNAGLRGYVRSILEGEYRVLEAGDGQEGLEMTKAELPDLIVTDVMMPVLDGYGFARALKQDPMTGGIPVIMLTARAATEDQVEGLETGVDAYLTKPFERAVLEAQVRGLIALRQHLRARYSQQPSREIDTSDPRHRSPLEARLREVIMTNLAEEDFSVARLAAEVGLSRSQLFRRLRQEASVTPTKLIRTVRVEQASRLFERRAGNVTEVAYAVGFKSLSHFTRCFREHFQVSPSAFLQSPGR